MLAHHGHLLSAGSNETNADTLIVIDARRILMAAVAAPGLLQASLWAAESDTPDVDPCVTRAGDVADERLWDRSYDVVSSGLCFPSRWVDRFFEDPDEVSDDPAHTQLRVIQANRWQDDDTRGEDLTVRARVRLPNLQERWYLVFRNDDDVIDDGEGLDDDPAEVGVEPAEEEDTTVRAAVRWAKKVGGFLDLDADVGVNSDIKSYVRTRYRFYTPLRDGPWWFRFGETVTWEDTEGWSARSAVEFDRPLNTRLTFRFNTEFEWRDVYQAEGLDWSWLQTASFYQVLGQRSAVQYLVGWSGFTDPVFRKENMRTAVRFRRSIWRPWLYYEIEPYAFWARSNDFEGVTGIVGRLEVQLGRYD